jgi:LPXTG-site transpeptidase (sortase) family protein
LNAVSPTPLNIVEPELTIIKIANVDTALPGAEITFTITVSHTGNSTADAYDVIVEDILPSGLNYVPGSLVHVSGIVPTTLDDTADPTLRVTWDVFGRSPADESVIEFHATLGNLPPNTSISNTARVEWTSLPGTPTAALGQPVGVQSQYNQRSIERWYDPTSPVDIYGVSSLFEIRIPALPDTGFAPGVQATLPAQSEANAYTSLGSLWLEIPTLGVQMPIVGIPANSQGWDLTWLGDDAGYLEGTAYPTWPGNTGITGHVTLPNGKPGPFANLSTLYWGQQVVLHMNGQKYIYEVRSVRRVWPQDISVLNHAEYSTITLITCQGYNSLENTYAYRVAVQAVLMRVEVDDQPSIPTGNDNSK